MTKPAKIVVAVSGPARVEGLDVDGYARTMLNKTLGELTQQRDAVIALLG